MKDKHAKNPFSDVFYKIFASFYAPTNYVHLTHGIISDRQNCRGDYVPSNGQVGHIPASLK